MDSLQLHFSEVDYYTVHIIWTVHTNYFVNHLQSVVSSRKRVIYKTSVCVVIDTREYNILECFVITFSSLNCYHLIISYLEKRCSWYWYCFTGSCIYHMWVKCRYSHPLLYDRTLIIICMFMWSVTLGDNFFHSRIKVL